MNISNRKTGDRHPSQAFYDLAMADEETLDEVEECPPPSPEEPGVSIAGRFVLKEVLGDGGTGQVWSAAQTAPVKREVAIKIIRPGLLAKPVSARFNREHQVLARVEHPNIAAVFDAGELPDGRTYFVMEKVLGTAITRWCESRGLNLKARLEVFLQACMAVHHAHQKGILHRDLKPSNVMVAEVDGKPLVKVIDFGIAKALEGDLALGQDVTLRGMVLGTPRYMSPEQAGLTGGDIDARADVYALGVLLYELLTGTTPILDDEEKDVALPELLQRVREAETELPSRRATRISMPAQGDSPQPKGLAQGLRGELDWILLRALQKDRAQRYPTALALAEDVQRYLRDEPVLARPPRLTYRLKKWLVRHRTGVIASVMVALTLAAGVAVTWRALAHAEAQRREAQRQAAVALRESGVAEQMAGQLKDLLENARKHVSQGMNTELLRQLADECAAGMPRFAGQPETEVQLAKQLAQIYTALEEPARALPWIQRQWELLKQTQGEHAPETLDALYSLGWRTIGGGDSQKAVELLRLAAAGYAALPDVETNAGLRLRRLLVNKELAWALSRAGKHEEALRLIAEVIQAKGDLEPESTPDWLRDQADVLKGAGRYQEAVAVLRQALDLVPADEAHGMQRSYILSRIANVTGEGDHHAEALQASSEGLRLLEAKVGSAHPQLTQPLIEHATLACRVPGCPGGEEAARRAVTLAQTVGHESLLVESWIILSETLRVKRLYRESEQTLHAAIEDVSETKAEKWRVMELHRRLGDLLTSRRAYEEALQEYEIAAQDWFTDTTPNRDPNKERLLFTSFIQFWKLAAQTKSPLADDQRLAEWEGKLRDWDATHRKQMRKVK